MKICREGATVVEYLKKPHLIIQRKLEKVKHVLPLHHTSHHPQCAQTPGHHRIPSECETAPACRLHPALLLAALQSKEPLLATPITFVIKSPFKLKQLSQVFHVLYSSLHAAMLLQIILNGTLLQYTKINNKCIKI